MEYTNNSAPAFSTAYMPREHPGLESTMNPHYSSTRSMVDYLRADSNPIGFNPLIESLNFASNPMNYENLPGGNSGQFTSWSSQLFTTDGRNGVATNKSSRTPYFRTHGQVTPDRLPQFPTDDYRSITTTSMNMDSLYCPMSKVGGLSGCQPNVHHTADIGNQLSISTTNHTTSTKSPLGMTNAMATSNPNYLNSTKTNGITDHYDCKLEINGLTACSGSAAIGVTTKSSVRRNSAPLTDVKSEPQGHISISDPKTMVTSPAACGRPVMQKCNILTTDPPSISTINKFSLSSDESEISPTPTATSSQTCTPGRTRKVAPTLATGRRNLKNEPVDADEADRRMKRRERNRKSAQKCRERKVQRTHELQAQVECLEKTANRLIQERDNFRNQALQYVSLLQQHCPGIAIPYLSCLHDTPDDLTCIRLSCNELTRSTTEKTMTNTSGWKQKLEGDSMIDGLSGGILTPAKQANHDDPLSPLPTMVSLQHHQHHHQQQQPQQQHQHQQTHQSQPHRISHTLLTPPDSRSKSHFTFNSDPSESAIDAETDSGFTSLISSSILHGGCETKLLPVATDRCINLRGQASASSSSPSSNYDMPYNSVDTSGQAVSTHVNTTNGRSFSGDTGALHPADANNCDVVMSLRPPSRGIQGMDFKHSTALVENGNTRCDTSKCWSPASFEAISRASVLPAGQHATRAKGTSYSVGTAADGRHETSRIMEANPGVAHIQEACFS